MSICRRIYEQLFKGFEGNGFTKLQRVTQPFFCENYVNHCETETEFKPDPPRIQVRSVRAPLNLLFVIIFFCFVVPMTEIYIYNSIDIVNCHCNMCTVCTECCLLGRCTL